jgi:hypothetical protein
VFQIVLCIILKIPAMNIISVLYNKMRKPFRPLQIFAAFVLFGIGIFAYAIPYLFSRQSALMRSAHLYSKSVEPFEIRKSEIAGVGVFSTKEYNEGDSLFTVIHASKDVEPTLGSKVNHCPSSKSNTKVVKIGDEWQLFATKALKSGDELTADYTDTPDFIRGPEPEWKC